MLSFGLQSHKLLGCSFARLLNDLVKWYYAIDTISLIFQCSVHKRLEVNMTTRSLHQPCVTIVEHRSLDNCIHGVVVVFLEK